MTGKILIADDEKDLVKAIIINLEEFDLVVHEAADGQEALNLFNKAIDENAPYDLILLDMMMPERDGKEVLEFIREKEREKGIQVSEGVPVILLSGLPRASVAAISGGAADHLIKPFGMNTLIKKIREKLVVKD